MSALRESFDKIVDKVHHNKTKLSDNEKQISSLSSHHYKRIIDDLNNNIETFKYDDLKIGNKNDKSNLEPIK